MTGHSSRPLAPKFKVKVPLLAKHIHTHGHHHLPDTNLWLDAVEEADKLATTGGPHWEQKARDVRATVTALRGLKPAQWTMLGHHLKQLGWKP